MTREILIGAGGLIVGLVLGFWGANSLNRNDAAAAGPHSGLAVTGGMASPDGAPTAGMQPDITEILAAAENRRDDFVTQMKAGDLYGQIGKYDKAIEFYKRGVELKPDDVQANLVLANAYFDAGQFDNAGAVYEKVLEIDPKNVAARTDLGTSFVERETPDLDRAIREFAAVLETEPKNEPALFNLAVAYSKKGDQQAARETLGKLEQANPGSELIAKLRQRIGTN